MILKIGECLHIIHRPFFDGDVRRHFVGSVEACEGSLARVKGYLFACAAKTNRFEKLASLRVRIVPLDSADLIINVLPQGVDLEKIDYVYKSAREIAVTDGSKWHLDLSHL